MASAKASVVRVAMARRVAVKWLQENASPEYRITVYAGSTSRNLPGLLRAFRDRKTRIASIGPIEDLGVETNSDRMILWSGNREGMLKLDQWLTKSGYETTGIW